MEEELGINCQSILADHFPVHCHYVVFRNFSIKFFAIELEMPAPLAGKLQKHPVLFAIAGVDMLGAYAGKEMFGSPALNNDDE